MSSYLISCESTADLPYAYLASRNIPVLLYSYTVDGQTYEDDMGRDPAALGRFYDLLAAGKLPQTAQINLYQYCDFFRALLRQGDVLHIAFSSALTGSVLHARRAAEMMREEFPDRRIIVIDSTCASVGYGLLVDCAADLRDRGAGLEEVAAWVTEQRSRVHHQFYSTDLRFFRRSGRLSGAAAMIATMLGICPIIRASDTGHLIAYDKVRGKKNAIARTIEVMDEHATDGAQYREKCFVCHSHCPAEAEEMRDAVLAHFKNLCDVPVYEIGTVIASHTGPGTVAVVFFGDERAPR